MKFLTKSLNFEVFILRLQTSTSSSTIMSLVLRKFFQQLDYFYESKAPVDTCGAPPGKNSNGSLEKRLKNLQDLVRKPAFTVNDLVSILPTCII